MKRLTRLRDTASALMFTLALPAVLAMALLKEGASRASVEFEFPALKEARGKLSAKQQGTRHDLRRGRRPTVDLAKVKSIDGGTAAKAAHIRALNDELSDLGKKSTISSTWPRPPRRSRTARSRREHTDDQAEPDGEAGAGPKCSARCSSRPRPTSRRGCEVELDFNVKTLLDTATGWAPETTRSPRLVVDFATRPIQLANLIPQTHHGEQTVTYMEETTFTNAAAETAEGVAKPEAALALTEKSSPGPQDRGVDSRSPTSSWRTYPASGPVPRQPAARSWSCSASTRRSSPATAPPRTCGAAQHRRHPDPGQGRRPDARRHLQGDAKVEVTGQAMAEPRRSSTRTTGRTSACSAPPTAIYIWGNPSDAGPERIWGLTVAKVQAATENTGIVADTQPHGAGHPQGHRRRRCRTATSTFFVENKQADPGRDPRRLRRLPPGRDLHRDGHLAMIIEGTSKVGGGLGRGGRKIAVASYDFAVDGGAVGAITLRGDSLPAGAVILDAYLKVTTAPTSGGAATISLGAETAAGLQAATAFDGAPFSTTGTKRITFTATTAPVTTTVVRAITATVAVAALTAGAFTVVVEYIEFGS